ncbi:hypothetical protein AXA84_0205 [Candidatus Phytoplasma oryzae]|uniref:Uncharacterized protein n=1 Tax=Candidatus Phytoplasma oryzae TaxID=203274 RepID=A0A139JQP0_9MOLU|nr:hypothetical protein [Candidatus Phytoplasma oryzae]KXT29258.1 hypothetical protein AXA84_0205 [Candidatus Phytoplasma oryzae]RAM57841.1 hypothetical protein DH96_00740 [Candidatus Phytoplasma oryzae]
MQLFKKKNKNEIKQKKELIIKFQILIIIMIFIFFLTKKQNVISEKVYASSEHINKIMKINKNNHNDKVIYIYDINQELIQKKYLLDNKDIEYFYNQVSQDDLFVVNKKIKINNQIICENILEYNEENQLIFEKNKNNKILIQYKYDKINKKLKSKIKFLAQENINFPIKKKVYNYIYNENGQKIKKIFYSITKTKRSWISKIFFFIRNKKIIDKLLCEYEYDHEGKIIKKIKNDDLGIVVYEYQYGE